MKDIDVFYQRLIANFGNLILPLLEKKLNCNGLNDINKRWSVDNILQTLKDLSALTHPQPTQSFRLVAEATLHKIVNVNWVHYGHFIQNIHKNIAADCISHLAMIIKIVYVTCLLLSKHGLQMTR